MNIYSDIEKKDKITVVKRALLVEDNVINQKVMNFYLSDLNYEVDVVNNANLAIEKIQVKTYDLMLIDIGLPGRPGIDVIEAARQFDIKLETPLLVWSAQNTKEDKEKFLKLGANAILKKNCSVEEVKNAIDDCCLSSAFERKFNNQLNILEEKCCTLDQKKYELATIEYVEEIRVVFREVLRIIEEHQI